MLKQQLPCSNPHNFHQHQQFAPELPLQDHPTQNYELKCSNMVSRSQLKTGSTDKQVDREGDVCREMRKEQTKWCFLHKKELQIFCITDRMRICPHCALFSTHREHQLRPAKEVAEMVRSFVEEFRQCSSRKIKLDAKLKSSEFRQSMIGKITAHKNSLISEIKHKFKQLFDNIKLAQKRAFDDVAKSFKSIAQQIVILDKQEQQNNLLYQKWELTCQQLLQSNSFDQKAYLLAAGGFDIVQQGSNILTAMERKADSKIQQIQRIVKSIKVQQSQSVPNSIFNYINIVVEQEQLQLQKKSEPLQLVKQQQEETIQFNSVKIIREPSSPLSHSHKRGSSSTQKTETNVLRKSTNRKPSKLELVTPLQLETIISQFCSKQNLETLDLSNCYLLDAEIIELLEFIKTKKKIKALKLGKNKLTSEGFAKMLDLIPVVTNLNLSFNQLSEQSVYELLRKRQKVPHLRIVNLSSNSINERRCQNAIEQLKKQGIIVTI